MSCFLDRYARSVMVSIPSGIHLCWILHSTCVTKPTSRFRPTSVLSSIYYSRRKSKRRIHRCAQSTTHYNV